MYILCSFLCLFLVAKKLNFAAIDPEPVHGPRSRFNKFNGVDVRNLFDYFRHAALLICSLFSMVPPLSDHAEFFGNQFAFETWLRIAVVALPLLDIKGFLGAQRAPEDTRVRQVLSFLFG